MYADCNTITVLYWDDDDDVILINSQDELSEAFKVGNHSVYIQNDVIGLFKYVTRQSYEIHRYIPAL